MLSGSSVQYIITGKLIIVLSIALCLYQHRYFSPATVDPACGVSSLEALSRNADGIGGRFIACPVMDARRNQLYNAFFLCDDDRRERLCEDRLVSAEKLAAELSEFSLPIYFFGDGYDIAKKAFPQASDTPKELILQNGASVAKTAFEVYTKAEDKSVFTDFALSPSYLRPSQAEREYNAKKEKESI